MNAPVPRRLLTEAELLALAPGDHVRRHDGDWFVVDDVYAPARSAGGVLLIGFHGHMVGERLITFGGVLPGPSHVSGSQWNGTRRDAVWFVAARRRAA